MMDCQSCGMPMEQLDDHAPGNPGSLHCRYCSRPDGSLQPFDERFERMVEWSMRQDGLPREYAESATRDYMRSMPLWKNHSRLADD
jgi:hypothetical protein